MKERVAQSNTPRTLGGPLTGPLRQYWRYRTGDYRIICDIQDDGLTVLALKIAHRSKVYSELK
jgi:mRNA interferase RelE/StbE